MDDAKRICAEWQSLLENFRGVFTLVLVQAVLTTETNGHRTPQDSYGRNKEEISPAPGTTGLINMSSQNSNTEKDYDKKQRGSLPPTNGGRDN